MIGVARIYSYRAGEFYLVDVPVKEAKTKVKELRAEGRIITHTETV